MNEAKRDKRSPLKGRPLRYAGQSLDREIDRLLMNKVLFWCFMASFIIACAFLEWYRWLSGMPPQPYLLSAFAVVAAVSSAYRIVRLRPELAALQLGRDGERAVGQYLEALREKGYRVFHDLVAEDFNLDHVLVSPRGIYTIETKTLRKPASSEAQISVRNGEVLADGHRMQRNPIEQARAQAKWLRGLLGETTGKRYEVRPVVVFPGWFVEPVAKSEERDVWVLNPKALRSFIEQESVTLPASEVSLISHHLTMHIRAREEELL